MEDWFRERNDEPEESMLRVHREKIKELLDLKNDPKARGDYEIDSAIKELNNEARWVYEENNFRDAQPILLLGEPSYSRKLKKANRKLDEYDYYLPQPVSSPDTLRQRALQVWNSLHYRTAQEAREGMGKKRKKKKSEKKKKQKKRKTKRKK